MEPRRGTTYALSFNRPRTHEAPVRRTRRGTAGEAPLVASIIVLVFAILLCLINAVVWTLVSEMPFMGLAWLLAAFACFYLQKWSRG
jgi:hypothetical protein